MDRNRLLSVAVAALCMASVGLAATTLDSTVSQDPGEAIDFRSDLVPLGDGTVMEIARQVERNEDGGESGANADGGEGSSGASAGGTADESDGGSGEAESERMADDRDSSEAGARPDDAGADSAASGEGRGPDSPTESLLDRLLALLESLVPLLVALAALALAYRYRERLFALLSLPVAAVGSADAATDGDDRKPWPPAEPADDVDRAWCALVRELDVERPWTKTPGECRRAAVEDGFDPEAVRTLTRVFREKHYGEEGPTDDHLERARQCADRIGLGGRPR